MPQGQPIDFDLASIRAQRGWSQDTLADRAMVNVRTIRRAEAGHALTNASITAIRRALFPAPVGLETASRVVIAQRELVAGLSETIEVRRISGGTTGVCVEWLVALVTPGSTWCLCPDGFLRRHDQGGDGIPHRLHFIRQADAILAAVAHAERHRRSAAIKLRMTGTRRRMVNGSMQNCAILSSAHGENLWTAEV